MAGDDTFMSDFKQEDNWWQGVDGKWYPPVSPLSEHPQTVQQSTTLVCNACQAQNSSTSTFCINCGQSISGLVPGNPLPSQQNAGTAKKRKVSILIGLVVLVGAGFAFIQSSKPESKTITGTYTLFSDNLTSSCQGSGGYSDIGPSTVLVVTGKDGTEYDRTRLGTGTYLYDSCMYTFKLKVEKGQDYYIISSDNRGELEYSWEELDDISLSLGN